LQQSILAVSILKYLQAVRFCSNQRHKSLKKPLIISAKFQFIFYWHLHHSFFEEDLDISCKLTEFHSGPAT
jgi:hypothetical protein